MILAASRYNRLLLVVAYWLLFLHTAAAQQLCTLIAHALHGSMAMVGTTRCEVLTFLCSTHCGCE
jgi:hypothetical protein